MVVCRHFQRGNCRFGASCKYEHSEPNYDSYYHANDNSRYVGDRYHYIKPSVATQPVKNDSSQIFDIVAADTMAAVRGRQWPFSSYAPVKGCQNIIGLEDISPEELRYVMYSAKETGNVEECKRHWNELLQIENMKRTVLMTPSAEADTAIQSIYRSEDQLSSNPIRTGLFQSSQPAASRTAAETHSASIFGGSHSTTPFAASTNAGVVFGGSSPMTDSNPFGANAFGAGNPASVFGSANSSIFGGSAQPASSVGGGPPSGLFSTAAAAVSQQSGGFFGSSVAQPVPGLMVPTGGFFGSAAQPPSGLFASAAANFGEQITGRAPNMFGDSWSEQPSVFGANSHTASIFGAGKQTSALPPSYDSFQGSNEPFGKPHVPSSTFHQAEDLTGSVYTRMADLDHAEKAAFEAKTFTSGKIPIRPPPRELCF